MNIRYRKICNSSIHPHYLLFILPLYRNHPSKQSTALCDRTSPRFKIPGFNQSPNSCQNSCKHQEVNGTPIPRFSLQTISEGSQFSTARLRIYFSQLPCKANSPLKRKHQEVNGKSQKGDTYGKLR